MSEGSSSLPRLSVIVPTCNRSTPLARCLAGLDRQSLPSTEFEVIVVDDSGSAEDVEVLPEDTGILHLKLIRHHQNSGAAAARNTGADAARGPFLAFVDDDCVPESEWASRLTDLLPDSDGAALVGAVLVAEPQPSCDRVTQLLSDPMDAGDGTLVRAQTANLAVPADGFAAVGGFDESYRGAGYEDYDFCQRWRASGRLILAAPGAIVLHRRDTTFGMFWRQHFRYGRGAARFYGQGAEGPHPPLKANLRRMVQTIGAGRTIAERVGHIGWIGLSQCAMLAGIAAERISRS